MTNLSDFLKVKTVRCVSKNAEDNLTIGKKYKVTHIIFGLQSDNNAKGFYDFDSFEPVLDSAENPLQNIELTPEFEVVEPTFKVGDKVYFPRLSKKLCVIGAGQEDDYVDEINGSKALAEMQSDLDFVYDQKTNSWLWGEKDCAPQLLHATPENHAMLSKLYPHIEFEQPPKELKGSDLCRAMLEKGWKYVPCYVHDGSDDEAINRKHYVSVKNETPRSGYNFSGTGANDWKYAVPIDPRTGEPLTQAVLDE